MDRHFAAHAHFPWRAWSCRSIYRRVMYSYFYLVDVDCSLAVQDTSRLQSSYGVFTPPASWKNKPCVQSRHPAGLIINPAMSVANGFFQNPCYQGGAQGEGFRLQAGGKNIARD